MSPDAGYTQNLMLGVPPQHSRSSTDVLRLDEVIKREFYPSGSVNRAFSQNVWVYAAVRLISETLAHIPFDLFKKTQGIKSNKNSRRGYDLVSDHPLVDLMDQPNEIMDAETFVEAWASRLLTFGNVWIQIGDPDSRGYPRELLIWGMGDVTPKTEKHSGDLLAWNVNIGNKVVTVPLDEMIHTALPNPYHPFMGLAPVTALAMQLDADLARTVFDKSFFKNNANPDAVLSSKFPLSKDQRKQVRDSWYETHGGPERGGGLAVLGGEFELKVLGRPHAESQFIENRSFTRQEVASVFKIPAVLLNDLDNNSLTREAMISAYRALYDSAVFPLCKKFKKSINRRILKPLEGRDRRLVFDFNYDTLPIMTDYLSYKSKILKELVQSGTPINDAIIMLDLDMSPIEGGDVGFLPSNYLPVPVLAEMEAPVPTDPFGGPSGGASSSKPKAIEDKGDDMDSDDEPKRAGSRAESLIINSLSQKIKRFLFELRTESLRYGNFNLKKSNIRWLRQVLPACAVGVQMGFDQENKIKDILDRKDQSEVDDFIHEMQVRADSFEFSDPRVEEMIFSVIETEFETIREYWDDLEGGEEVRDVFFSCQKKAKDIARAIVSRSMDCGKAGLGFEEN